jgi:hypothetical protein
MSVIVLLISFTLATLFGIGSMLVLGEDVVTSELSTQIFFGIMVIGTIVAVFYELRLGCQDAVRKLQSVHKKRTEAQSEKKEDFQIDRHGLDMT